LNPCTNQTSKQKERKQVEMPLARVKNNANMEDNLKPTRADPLGSSFNLEAHTHLTRSIACLPTLTTSLVTTEPKECVSSPGSSKIAINSELQLVVHHPSTHITKTRTQGTSTVVHSCSSPRTPPVGSNGGLEQEEQQ
jgi:hypothetical protein